MLIILFLPLSISALSNDYVDEVAKFSSAPIQDEKINVYFFRGQGCMYCEREISWLREFEEIYKDDIVIYSYEVWENQTNKAIIQKVKEDFGYEADDSVPFTVVGDKAFRGFGPEEQLNIENAVREYLGLSTLNSPSVDIFNSAEASQSAADNNQNDNETKVVTEAVDDNTKGLTAVDIFTCLALLGTFSLEICASYYIFVKAQNAKKEPNDEHFNK